RFADAHRLYERLGYARSGRSRELHDLSDTTELEFVATLDGAHNAYSRQWQPGSGNPAVATRWRERCSGFGHLRRTRVDSGGNRRLRG
ncbi:MAG: hypothetical protein ACXV5Q_15030, partial [Frankiaceae bacterium]